MEQLFKSLLKYGNVIVGDNGYDYWRCGCEVKIDRHSSKSEMVTVTGKKLYFTLRELLKQSAIVRKKLMDDLKAPKQGEFNYGSTNKDWKEIA